MDNMKSIFQMVRKKYISQMELLNMLILIKHIKQIKNNNIIENDILKS